MRKAEIKRKTKETDIVLSLDIDGKGISEIDTGCGFLDHMLELFAKHSSCDLSVKAVGDTRVDYHHTVEDTGIVLGSALKEALGDKKGINRYGSIVLPMDEALILCAVDLSGRSYLGFDITIPAARVGDFDTELVKEFWYGFIRSSEITLHFKEFAGENSHHIIEGAFKAAARAIKAACSEDPGSSGELPSTKGLL